MGMFCKFKGFNLFQNGENFVGQVVEVMLLKFMCKMEDYQGGGMSGLIKVDFGQEGIQFEWICGGFMCFVFGQYVIMKYDGVLLCFVGGY